MAIKFIKVSVVYFTVGVILGMYMSMQHDYTLTGVHVHINLLGWASFALAGIIYFLFPKAGNHVLAKVHFWGANIGLPLMMGGLATLLVSGAEQATIFISIGATLVVLSVILFAYNVLMNVRVPVVVEESD
ncbi:cytochrome-c oxidase [Paenisporosarcina indica]|uniref:cytochrome-c oxidase n=1 Tax=Paenisporosarcina indica TaxID=650093 RepID=UPI0009502443|nr:cytochrome-c oxidase [Paenisporosarcina indica]